MSDTSASSEFPKWSYVSLTISPPPSVKLDFHRLEGTEELGGRSSKVILEFQSGR